MQYGVGTVASSSANSLIAGLVAPFVPRVDIARTNLLLQSNGFNSASWSTVGTIVVTAASILSPDGTVDGFTLNDTDVAVLSERRQDVAIANNNTIYCASCYVSAGTSNDVKLQLQLTGGTVVTASAEFNPQSGLTIGLVGSGSSILSFVLNGVTWYRLQVCAQNNTSGNVNARVSIIPAAANAGQVGTVFVFGAQLETAVASNLNPSGYIPTAAVAVTTAPGKIPYFAIDPRLNISIFTANGTFVWPAGVTTVYVNGCAAGGGGGGSLVLNEVTGGGGAQCALYTPLTTGVPGTSYSITVPSTGGAGGNGANGTAGGNASVGALLTLVGGGAGTQGAAVLPRSSAGGFGGQEGNSSNGLGATAKGGDCIFGNGGYGGTTSSNALQSTAGSGYGSGGGGNVSNAATVAGSAGAPGIIILQW